MLDAVRRMQPSRILSSHLPAAGGHRVERFLDLLGTLPDADTFVPPGCEEFSAMVAGMAAAASAGAAGPPGRARRRASPAS